MDETFGYEETEGQGDEVPEGTEDIAPEEQPEEKDWAAEYEALQKKLGTEEDVNAVKSQRDQARHQLEEYQAQLQQWEQERAQYQQALSQAQQQLQYYMQQQYAQMSPEQQAMYAQQAQQAQYQQYLAQLQQQNQEYRQKLAEIERQRQVEPIKQAIMRTYSEAARAAGVDPNELDFSSMGALEQSYTEKVKPLLGARQSPPPAPPQTPNRGVPTPPPSIDAWFQNTIKDKGLNEVERIFDLVQQGADPRTLMR